MEAVAKFDFDASQHDELSFTKDSRLYKCQLLLNHQSGHYHQVFWITPKIFVNSQIKCKKSRKDVEYFQSEPKKALCSRTIHYHKCKDQHTPSKTRKVTSKEDDGDWFIAFSGNQSGFIPATYIEMEPHPWYREKLGRSQAEKLMLTKSSNGSYVHPNGAFIIRKSESDVNGFALSVRCDSTVQHFKILRDFKNRFYIWPKTTFASLNELVKKYKTESVSGDTSRDIFLKEIHQEICQAMFDFAPANDEELALKRGDLIKVLAKIDPNWWEGEIDGRIGFFPMNYVKQIA